jgi:hypothetical protein
MKWQIFTADEPEVESLPRAEVTQYLEQTNKEACVGYLEHIIGDLKEEGSEYHDRLAQIYLEKARESQGRGGDVDGKAPGKSAGGILLCLYRAFGIQFIADEKGGKQAVAPEREEKSEEYVKLLDFLESSKHYRPYRLLNRLSGEG